MAFVCLSKGKDAASWLIRYFTTLLLRKDAMVAAEVPNIKSWWLLFIAQFGFTEYAAIKAVFNHAFILYNSVDFNQKFSIDIRQYGPVPQPASKALKKCAYIRIVEPTFDIFTGVRALDNDFNTGYDWLAIIGGVILILWYCLTGRRSKHPLHSPGRNVCSEYVTSVINHSAGADNLGDPILNLPQILADKIEASPQYNLVYEGKPKLLDLSLL